MNNTKTERGFALSEFVDRNGEACSLQKSSSAIEDSIWLGITNPDVKICIKGIGWRKVEMPEDALISGRMHLNQEQVAELIPHLQRFVETGEV